MGSEAKFEEEVGLEELWVWCCPSCFRTSACWDAGVEAEASCAIGSRF